MDEKRPQNITPIAQGDDVRKELDRMSREPFKDFLANLLGAAPDAETLKEWAQKSPDRFAQALAIAGRLSGYTEKAEVVNHHLDYSDMSDSALMEAAAQLEAELRGVPLAKPSEEERDTVH